MRVLGLSLVALLAMAAPAGAAPQTIQTIPGQITTYATTDLGGAGIPTVSRGTEFAIACTGIRSETAQVSVVMSLGDGETSPGYNAVLATNQVVAKHGVRVTVPDVPDIANHTVAVKVYVTDEKGTRACDAGRVKIV